ncbi:MAG: hypothetical protein ACLFPL_03420 [Candidatus Nanoarchaeia archaeon]
MDSSQFKSFKEQIKKSFSACREDIETLQHNSTHQSSQINELINQIKQRDDTISMLQSQINSTQELFQQTQKTLNIIQQTLQQMQSQMSMHTNSSMQQHPQQQNKNSSNITANTSQQFTLGKSNVSQSQDFYSAQLSTTSQTMRVKSNEQKMKKNKDPYEALLEFKAKINKKEVIKQKLLSTIPNEGMILSELRFLFVEHFEYCSKATFYNYLKELEYSKQIRTEREYSKNFVYLQGSVQTQSNYVPQLNLD